VLDVAGYQVAIRATSSRLFDQIRRPLAHLEVRPDEPEPCCTIDFIDGADADENLIVLPAAAQRSSPEQETQEFQAGPYLFTLHGDSVLTAYNQGASHTIGIVRDPGRWPLDHYQQALFISLYQHLIQRGLYLIHASAIGRNGKALLFSAKSGAGKTTTMLTCVRAGFDFYSDDATLLRRSENGQIDIVPLLGTMNVTETTLRWFPELLPYTSKAVSRTGKRLVMMGDVYPQRMATTGTVQAVIAPEIAGQTHATLSSMSKMGLLRELLPFSLDLHDADAAKTHLDFLLEVLRQVPCYRLRLGQIGEELPELLERALATPG
jgi:hypothetical protein